MHPFFYCSWHLQQILESLDYTQLPEAHHCLLQSSFAAQLESIGLWEWAVFVLMHIKNGRRYVRKLFAPNVLSGIIESIHFFIHLDKFISFPAPALVLFMSVAKAIDFQSSDRRFDCPHHHSHCIFCAGTRSNYVQRNQCTSQMRSQSQMRNDKYIMMQYTNWINSTPSQQ